MVLYYFHKIVFCGRLSSVYRKMEAPKNSHKGRRRFSVPPPNDDHQWFTFTVDR